MRNEIYVFGQIDSIESWISKWFFLWITIIDDNLGNIKETEGNLLLF